MKYTTRQSAMPRYDGTIFHGKSIGTSTLVKFINTGINVIEIFTDPSYFGNNVKESMLIGNYGVNEKQSQLVLKSLD
jgi:carbamoylphosphate synthase small subunit